MDLDILKTLTETGNPFVNILAIVGSYSNNQETQSINRGK